jgi:hypothetical protein
VLILSTKRPTHIYRVRNLSAVPRFGIRQERTIWSGKSGRYYARIFGNGKEVWKSLKTSHFQVAQARLAEFLKDHRQRVGNGIWIIT